VPRSISESGGHFSVDNCYNNTKKEMNNMNQVYYEVSKWYISTDLNYKKLNRLGK
jgi:hypothetical protein